ncbi:MAG TPA: DsbA family oxidoreductase [Burkholderiales bacterium]|nr:DsbA family oxidoreductase [Burkholderiales bacterium]
MGKRRLATALAQYRERVPDAALPAVRWLPFQLNPDLPEEGIARAEYLRRKFGNPNRSYGHVAQVGASVGIPFAFERITVQPNTLHAHRLMHYADQRGRQDEMAETLFQAYFIEGANLADRTVLAEVGARAGFERGALAEYLASDADRELIARADSDARNAGIGGVPFFIFNRRIGVSGAQEPETLLEAMLQAEKEASTAA